MKIFTSNSHEGKQEISRDQKLYFDLNCQYFRLKNLKN